MRKWNVEMKVAEFLMDGETTAAQVALETGLSMNSVKGALGELIHRGEVEARVAPDRSGEPGRSQTLYSMVRTKRKAA